MKSELPRHVFKRATSPVAYRADVPETYHTDFKKLGQLHCKEVWAYSTHAFGVSFHSAFLLVMDDGQVYLAEGRPTKSPRPQSAVKLTVHDICSRLGLSKRQDMGYLMPIVRPLGAIAPRIYSGFGGGDLNKEQPGTMRFKEVIPGKGMDGVSFFKRHGSRVVTLRLFGGDRAQKAYEDILRVAHTVAASHVAYELVPGFERGTMNCHSFTEMALYQMKRHGLVADADIKRFYNFSSRFHFGVPGSSHGGLHSGIEWLDHIFPQMRRPEYEFSHLGHFRHHDGAPVNPKDIMPFSLAPKMTAGTSRTLEAG